MTGDALPILAFGFASPWLLWGLALGSLPIIVHLLHKRRFRETPWAAMRFLLEAARKNSRRLRLEQLILLAVRVMILVLLALALAQPYMESFGTYFQADVPTHRVLVVDASLSMGYQPAEFSRFDQARGMARRIAAASKQGDALNLVRIADSLPRAIVARPAFQKNRVIDEVDQMKLTDEPGDVAAALQAAVELLQQAPELRRKEVYLITDLQQANWWPDSSARRSQVRRLLKEVSDKARITVLDVGGGAEAAGFGRQTGSPATGQERSPNAAITGFVVEEPFITPQRPVALRATLRNFGTAPLSEQLVELHVDDRLAATKRVELAPGEDVRVDFTHTFHGSGEHRLEVRLAGDALRADDRRWLSLPVRDELNILLVNGRQAGRESGNATHYLRTVLSPSTPGRLWEGVTRPHVIHDGELPATDLSRYDCVFLSNVGLFTEREAGILQAYVESGGGLVICLGDQVRAENYNQILHRGGEGLLPVRLGDRRGDPRNPQEPFLFDPGDLTHPIVQQYEGNPGRGLETTMAFAYVRAEIPDDSPASVALRFTSGDPAIVDVPVGRGRVVLFTTSVDNRWGPWPMQTSFPPIVHETVRHAVAGRWSERQRLVGEPLERVFPVRDFNVPVTVKRPDGRTESLVLAEDASFARLHYEPTDRSGVYEVALGGRLARTELFAVNVDPVESDLEKLYEKEVEAELLPGVEFAYQTQWQAADRTGEAAVAQRGGLTRWLLMAALGLVFVEQLMAWRFLYGLSLLGGVAALAVVAQAFTVSAAGGALAAAAATCAVLGTAALLRSRGRAAGARL